jgi:hypothetical protein
LRLSGERRPRMLRTLRCPLRDRQRLGGTALVGLVPGRGDFTNIEARRLTGGGVCTHARGARAVARGCLSRRTRGVGALPYDLQRAPVSAAWVRLPPGASCVRAEATAASRGSPDSGVLAIRFSVGGEQSHECPHAATASDGAGPGAAGFCPCTRRTEPRADSQRLIRTHAHGLRAQ